MWKFWSVNLEKVSNDESRIARKEGRRVARIFKHVHNIINNKFICQVGKPKCIQQETATETQIAQS
jgi:hypothetical protein